MRIVLPGLVGLVWCASVAEAVGQTNVAEPSRVVVESQGWKLVGDLTIPVREEPIPAVLMLNAAAGNRTPYAGLSRFLAERGIGSLRLDLRGHGESVGLGQFVPGARERDPLIWEADADVSAAVEYLRSDRRIDGSRLGIVGASYSGEEMAEAARKYGYVRAYVALSPGSFSDESILGIDASGAAWLFIVSKDDRFVQEIADSVGRRSQTVELMVFPGSDHGTEILSGSQGVVERITEWLVQSLLGDLSR